MVFSFKNLATASTILSLAQGAVIGKRSTSGIATTYGGNTVGGDCSFSTYTLPSNLFGTALAIDNWDTAAQCGRCVSVTGPGPTYANITAMITDQCPSCEANQLDLYTDAFAVLDPTPGIIDITWDYVDCPITTPLELHNKAGVSAYWFSMQVVNANEGVASLEVSTDSGSTWQSTTRSTYNFFEYTSGYGSTVDIKVTSISGATVIVNDVAITSDSSVTASSNFGTSSGTTVAAVASSSSSVAVVASSSVAAVVVASSSSVEVAPTSSSSSIVEVAPTTSATPTASPTTSVTPTASPVTSIIPTASPITPSTTSSLAAPTQSVVWVYGDSDECEL